MTFERLLARLMSLRLANGSGLILLILARMVKARFSQLQKERGIDSTKMAHALKPLVEQGLIKREVLKGKPYYSLTEQGKDVFLWKD